MLAGGLRGMPEPHPSSKFSGLGFITIPIFFPKCVPWWMLSTSLSILGLHGVQCIKHTHDNMKKKHKQSHSQGLIWERCDIWENAGFINTTSSLIDTGSKLGNFWCQFIVDHWVNDNLPQKDHKEEKCSINRAGFHLHPASPRACAVFPQSSFLSAVELLAGTFRLAWKHVCLNCSDVPRQMCWGHTWEDSRF